VTLRAGIPTTHRARRYRSRLEARWASMFDLLGWRYEYEPFDLAGWIPDFVLIGKSNILVEVKPILAFDHGTAGKVTRAADTSRHEGTDILLLGCTVPAPLGLDWNLPALGWLGEGRGAAPEEREPERHWGGALLGRTENEGWDVYHETGDYTYRLTGAYGGAWHVRSPDPIDVEALWAEAGNIVQWKVIR
jgi:hypothetical protein